jgi:hypothetical protein
MVGMCDQASHICEWWLHMYVPYLHFGETPKLSHVLEIFLNCYYRPYAVDVIDGSEAVEGYGNFETAIILIPNLSLAAFVIIFCCWCSD